MKDEIRTRCYEILRARKSRQFGLLRYRDLTWIESQKRYKEGETVPAMSGSDRARLLRIRRRTEQVLQDLAYLAEMLPEKQQSQIFTPTKILPFIHSLLGWHLKEKGQKRVLRHYQLARMFYECSEALFGDKLKEKGGPLWYDTWKKFVEIREKIQTIIPEKGYTAKTVNGKLVVEEITKKP